MTGATSGPSATVIRALVQSAVQRAGSHSALARAIGYRRETIARWLDAGQVSDRGQAALRAYLTAGERASGQDELDAVLTTHYLTDGATPKEALAGMLADLRHLANGYLEPWEAIVRQADDYYADELPEPPDP